MSVYLNVDITVFWGAINRWGEIFYAGNTMLTNLDDGEFLH